MKQTSFADMQCAIAQCLERTGEWWNLLILRDVLKGYTRFDQFQRSLGIPPSSLARRLAGLVESGILEKRLYQQRPDRWEYLPTAAGRDFMPVIAALLTWGMTHTPPDRNLLQIADRRTGKAADPVLIDRVTGEPITDDHYGFRAGPDSDTADPLVRLMQLAFDGGASDPTGREREEEHGAN